MSKKKSENDLVWVRVKISPTSRAMAKSKAALLRITALEFYKLAIEEKARSK